MSGEEHNKISFFRFKGIFPAVALILLGAVLTLSSNLLLTDKTKTAVQNAQTQAQTVQESSLCQEAPEEEEACIQSKEILENPTSRSIQGPQGIQGGPGEQGSQGPRGPQGLVGKGEKGDTGAQGIQGVPGLEGPIGLRGPAGIDGVFPTGVDINCQASTVTVFLSDGSTFVGSATCTPGPKGDKGDQGPAGPTGPTGPPGAQGPAGAPAPVPVPVPVPEVPVLPDPPTPDPEVEGAQY